MFVNCVAKRCMTEVHHASTIQRSLADLASFDHTCTTEAECQF